jgi:type II secretory pathway pseudopilin PulG
MKLRKNGRGRVFRFNRLGYTLIEILVALGLGIFVLIGVFKLFSWVRHHFTRTAVRQTLQQEVRRVARLLTNDLQAAKSGTIKLELKQNENGKTSGKISFRRYDEQGKTKKENVAGLFQIVYDSRAPLLTRVQAPAGKPAAKVSRVLTSYLVDLAVREIGDPGKNPKNTDTSGGKPLLEKPDKPSSASGEAVKTYQIAVVGGRNVPGSSRMEFHREATLVTVREEPGSKEGFLSQEEMSLLDAEALGQKKTDGDSVFEGAGEMSVEDLARLGKEVLADMLSAEKANLEQILTSIQELNDQIDSPPSRGFWTTLKDGVGYGRSDLGKIQDEAGKLKKADTPAQVEDQVTKLRTQLQEKEDRFLKLAYGAEAPSGEKRELMAKALRMKMLDRRRHMKYKADIDAWSGQAQDAPPGTALPEAPKDETIFREMYKNPPTPATGESEGDFAKRKAEWEGEKKEMGDLFNRADLSKIMGAGNGTLAADIPIGKESEDYRAFEFNKQLIEYGETKATLLRRRDDSKKSVEKIQEAMKECDSAKPK